MFADEGHKKDNMYAKNQNNSLSRFDMESTDQHLIFISQKSEKITIALYMITDFLKDNEPFKWEMRNGALQFMSFIESLKGLRIASQKEHAIQKSLPILSHTLSLLRLGVSIRFISQMNYSILRDEYTSLYETLRDRLQMNQPVDGLMLPQDFFDLKNDDFSIGQSNNYKGQSKGQRKGQSQGHRHENNDFVQRQDAISDTNLLHKDTESSDEHKSTELAPIDNNSDQSKNLSVSPADIESRKGMRQDIILRLLKTRGGISIKDISGVISGCGEKTIQRELASLVQRGLVRKMGQRRWSTYELI